MLTALLLSAGYYCVVPLAYSLLDESLTGLSNRVGSDLWLLWPLQIVPSALFALLPVLLWVALQFDPRVFGISYLLYAGFAVFGALGGEVALIDYSPLGKTLSVQVFLIGNSVLLLLLFVEIRERRKEQALFSKALQLTSDALSVSTDIRGRILDVNERWQALFGYRRGEVIGKTPYQLNLYASDEDCAAVIQRNTAQGGVRNLEVTMRSKEGGIMTLVLSGEQIDVGGKPRFIAALRDVTEQRKVASELQSQRQQIILLTRVALLGKLSGAFAHELNQPLTAILGNAQAARRILDKQPPDLRELQETVDDIIAEGRRASEIIRRLRALFMKGEAKKQPLNINRLVEDTLKFARVSLREYEVTVSQELDACPGEVLGDWVQLQQVLLNLIVNACESMNDSRSKLRRLKLSTDAEEHGYVQLAVADTGPGISPDAIDKVFDAFFTTKTQGTGFGLSISHAIVAAHGGRIEAVNNPGGGATFRVILPAHVGVSS